MQAVRHGASGAQAAWPAPGDRVSVIGSSCSGKTTMSRGLADALGLLHVEMDALYHGPDWTPRPWPVVRALVEQVTNGDRWVVDGNYSEVRPSVWPRADTVVWLDYRLSVVLWRLLRRTSRRIALREELWNGNREDVRTFLFSRDSLLLWVLQTYHRRKRQYPELLARPEHAHLTLVHLATPRQADDWLAAVRRAYSPHQPRARRTLSPIDS
ncbi:MAG: adenylate kinase [Anaerolineae bacterium]|jgi:adenylate kinase family enzyme